MSLLFESDRVVKPDLLVVILSAGNLKLLLVSDWRVLLFLKLHLINTASLTRGPASSASR